MSFDVFISYSNNDKPIADATCAALEAAHVRCWIAPRDILPGADWSASIIEALDQCRAMVLIFSASANDSLQIRNEVARAVHRGVPVIPVRIENIPPTKSLAYFIGAVHWLDALTPPIENHLKRLADSVSAMLHPDASPGSHPEAGHGDGSPSSYASPSLGQSQKIEMAPSSITTHRIAPAIIVGLCGVAVILIAGVAYFWFAPERSLFPKTTTVTTTQSKPADQASTPAAPTSVAPSLYDQLLTRYAVTIPGLSREFRETNARDYVRERTHKAQAVSLFPPGIWRASNRQSADIAEESALENCQVIHGRPCALIVVNDTLLPAPEDGNWPRRDMPRARYAGSYDPNQIPGVSHLRQRPDIAGYAAAAGPKAVAYGPASRVIVETHANSQREAEERVLKLCNDDLRRNDISGDCLLYATGNQVVLPQRLKKPIS
jgi:hypothetical protein